MDFISTRFETHPGSTFQKLAFPGLVLALPTSDAR